MSVTVSKCVNCGMAFVNDSDKKCDRCKEHINDSCLKCHTRIHNFSARDRYLRGSLSLMIAYSSLYVLSYVIGGVN